MTVRLRNTLTRNVEPVEPLEAGRVRMYSCGPTVYRYAHVGNLRSYLLADQNKDARGRLYLAGERLFDTVLNFYERTLCRALQWPPVVMLSLFATLGSAISGRSESRSTSARARRASVSRQR